MANTECGLATRALTGPAEECGDAGVPIERDGWLFAALVDGLGHGPRAVRIAALATTYLEGHCAQPLVALLDGLHEELKSTQGAVACLCRLDLASGELSMAGIGNITCRIFTGLDSERRLSRDGVRGYMHAIPKEYTRRLSRHQIHHCRVQARADAHRGPARDAGQVFPRGTAARFQKPQRGPQP